MPIDPITALMIAQGVGSIFSAFSGGGDAPEIDPELEQLIMSMIESENTSGFLPDKGAFDRSFRAKSEQILSRLPVRSEAFEADLASRGIRGAGEATKYKYSEVYTPIAQASQMAAAEAELGYAGAYQQGRIAQEQIRSANVARLMQLHLTKLGYQYQDYIADQTGRATFWGDIGTSVGYLGAMNAGRVFGSGGAVPS